MTFDTRDTIAALATPAGPGARAVIRLSGPQALAVALRSFRPVRPIDVNRQSMTPGELDIPDVHAKLPADLFFWPNPRSLTGQDVVELHTLSSPPLIEALIGGLLAAGARAAGPGEFTLRAFLSGKLDLTRAEAVLGVIEADGRDDLKQALAQLAGGVARPLQALREDLLNLLADLEAALDFVDEDIHFVGEDETLKRLGAALAQVTLLGRQLDRRAAVDRPYRVVLAGRPNAGKSSLFNALVGQAAALVSEEAGTTRDYLVRRLELGTVAVELVDTAGWSTAADAIARQSQGLGRSEAEKADLVLLCIEASRGPDAIELEYLTQPRPPVMGVATKCDRGSASADLIATSVVSGFGLGLLRSLLAERVAGRAAPALAPSLSRCRHHVAESLAALRRAHTVVIERLPGELLALEVRAALDQLGEMVGAVYTDDLLDRVFSRFCIGK
jgi:tRNA modification GTPase